MQALKKAVEGVFQSDVLTSMLNTVKDDVTRRNLCIWVRELLAVIDTNEARRWMQDTKIGQQLADVFEAALQFARAIAFLFQISVGAEAVQPSLDHVQWFSQFNGPSVWRRSVKGLLRNPEAQGPNFSQLKSDSREMLRSLHQEAVKTAATSGPALQQLGALRERLAKATQVPEPGCCQPLGAVLADLENLEQKLRKGVTQDLRKECCEFTRKMTEEARCSERE